MHAHTDTHARTHTHIMTMLVHKHELLITCVNTRGKTSLNVGDLGAAESSQYGPGAITHNADWQVALKTTTTINLHISKLYYIGISVNKPQMIKNILLKSFFLLPKLKKQQHDGPSGCGH